MWTKLRSLRSPAGRPPAAGRSIRVAMFRHRAKDPCPVLAETLDRDSRTRRTNDVESGLAGGWPARGRWRLMLPAVASADTLDAAVNGALPDSVAINSIWVVVAALLVIFMQAGFAFLEIGFSRGKNAGTVVAKILDQLLDRRDHVLGDRLRLRLRQRRASSVTAGFFLRDYGDPQKAFAVMGLSDATIESKWLFQFSFCAVSLAIVWGTTLERIKFGVYMHLRRRLRRRSSTRSPRTGSSAAAGCRTTSACRTSPARRRST